MDLDVVIVNWNGGDLVHQCVESLMALDTPFRLRVILVDNASRDGSARKVAADFPRVIVLETGENLGFGRGNNAARPHVQAPLVLFLNPDTTVPQGTLDVMVEHMQSHPDTGAIGCKMTDEKGEVHGLGLQWFPTPWTEFLQIAVLSGLSRKLFARALPTVDADRDGYVKKLYGGCLLARRDVLDAIGWFDERFFMYAEDVDMCRQISDRGLDLFYCSRVSLCHISGGVTREAPSTFPVLMKCESLSGLMRKYYGSPGAMMHRAALLSGSILRLVLLLPIRAGAIPLGRKSSPRLRMGFEKARLVLLWSLGLRRPQIPE